MKYAIIMGDVVFCCELKLQPQKLLNHLNIWDIPDRGPFARTSHIWDNLEDEARMQWYGGVYPDVYVIENKPPIMGGKPVIQWADHVIYWTPDMGFYFERCLEGDCKGNCGCK